MIRNLFVYYDSSELWPHLLAQITDKLFSPWLFSTMNCSKTTIPTTTRTIATANARQMRLECKKLYSLIYFHLVRYFSDSVSQIKNSSITFHDTTSAMPNDTKAPIIHWIKLILVIYLIKFVKICYYFSI